MNRKYAAYYAYITANNKLGKGAVLYTSAHKRNSTANYEDAVKAVNDLYMRNQERFPNRPEVVSVERLNS